MARTPRPVPRTPLEEGGKCGEGQKMKRKGSIGPLGKWLASKGNQTGGPRAGDHGEVELEESLDLQGGNRPAGRITRGNRQGIALTWM